MIKLRLHAVILVALTLFVAPHPSAANEVETRAIPTASSLPFGREATLDVGIPGRLDSQGTLHNAPGGSFTLVYASSIGVDYNDPQLHIIRSEDGRAVSATQVLRLSDRPIVLSPAFVEDEHQKTWLYLSVGDSFKAVPEVWRAAFDGQVFSDAERTHDIPHLERLIGWPRWVSHNGQLVVSFRGRRSRPYWAAHKADAAPAPEMLEDAGRAYVRVVPMTGGGWLLSYQHRETDHGEMLTFVRFSVDGKSWTPPEPITMPEAPNFASVHDAYALPRTDRGVDLYYSYPSPRPEPMKGGFDLYRRAVLGPGQFGPEQRLTNPAHFRAFASSAHRLADGAVLLTFSSIKSASGWVSEAQQHIVRLPGDAPLD